MTRRSLPPLMAAALAATLLAPLALADERQDFVESTYHTDWQYALDQGGCAWDDAAVAMHQAGQDSPLTDEGKDKTVSTLSTLNDTTYPVAIVAVDDAAFLAGPGVEILLGDSLALSDWAHCLVFKSFVNPVARSLVWENPPAACYARDTTNCGFAHTFDCVDDEDPWHPGVMQWGFDVLDAVVNFPPQAPPGPPDAAGCATPPGEPSCVPGLDADWLACVPLAWCQPPNLVLP